VSAISECIELRTMIFTESDVTNISAGQ